MIRKSGIAILIALLSQLLAGQPATYTVNRASFSSEKFDEFSPVYFGNGIVYCSNRSFGLSSHSSEDQKGMFNIVYVDLETGASRLFSKNITSIMNDGPVTFNGKKDTIYFSRNQYVDAKMKISGPRNKLGIFYAVLADGQWTRVRDIRINNEWYNVTTPWLSPDGRRLYFASDKPGGYGGSDIYYSEWHGDRWGDPVNLGPVINTKGNESYPYSNTENELFFSSDGHPGLGGKDIFFSMMIDSVWQKPVHLDPPINSQYDDFGIITDKLFHEGYFSSSRNKSIDIFKFTTNSPQVLYDIQEKENVYCFMFTDRGSIQIDTANLKYMWTFSDGHKASGFRANHCFPGKGKYSVKLDIYDRKTNMLFFSKLSFQVELKDYIQPYINSSDSVVKGDVVSFDGSRSNIPGYQIVSYSWNFGDGSRGTGEKVTHAYKTKGTFSVNMELVLKSGSGAMHKTGVTKKIVVFDSNADRSLSKVRTANASFPEIWDNENVNISKLFSAEDEAGENVVYNVELLSSKTKLGVNNSAFRNVPKKYTISEKFIPEDSTYSYIVDQQMNLMATYPAYRELYSLGFRNVRVKTYVLTDASEIELHNLIRINGAFADTYFDAGNKLTSNAYVMLDQIVKLMNKYPGIKLEIAVHADNSLPSQQSIALSQTRAQSLVSYLQARGINTRRLRATGFGNTKPIASDTDQDRKLNRRIDFIIIK